MTTTYPDLSAALAGYAERFHGGVPSGHHVASPLGAWLLAALCAPAATGDARHELESALGVEPQAAASLAAELLAHPHPLVAAAAAVWRRPQVAADLAGWLGGLPPGVSTGDLPGQERLDAWARDHTYGIIRSFPIQLTPELLVLLATALATRVSWERPFDVAPVAELGPGSAWAGQVRQVLRTPGAHGHDQFIAATRRAGDVAAHTARARPSQPRSADGLSITSVIADPRVPAPDVLATAHELAVAAATGGHVVRRSLFELPLGDTPLWTVREERVQTAAPHGREERYTALLPAWSASSRHDLGRPELGLPAAASTLGALLGNPALPYQAVQSAAARYTRTGFEAAAVSGMAVLTSMPQYRDGVRRVAELRFGRPYAVVAVATQQGREGAGPWHGLPVFSAWVQRADEVD